MVANAIIISTILTIQSERYWFLFNQRMHIRIRNNDLRNKSSADRSKINFSIVKEHSLLSALKIIINIFRDRLVFLLLFWNCKCNKFIKLVAPLYTIKLIIIIEWNNFKQWFEKSSTMCDKTLLLLFLIK